MVRRTWVDFGCAAVVFAVAMAAEALCATVWVHPALMVFVVFGVWFGAVALVMIRLGVARQHARLGWLYALMAVSCCAVLEPSFLVQPTVLHERGVHETAVVMEWEPEGDPGRIYRLSTADGPVPGWLRSDDFVSPGDRVDIYADPKGQFHPMFATDVDDRDLGGYPGLAVLLGLIYGMVLVAVWFAVRPGESRVAPQVVVTALYSVVPVVLAVCAVVLLVQGAGSVADGDSRWPTRLGGGIGLLVLAVWWFVSILGRTPSAWAARFRGRPATGSGTGSGLAPGSDPAPGGDTGHPSHPGHPSGRRKRFRRGVRAGSRHPES